MQTVGPFIELITALPGSYRANTQVDSTDLVALSFTTNLSVRLASGTLTSSLPLKEFPIGGPDTQYPTMATLYGTSLLIVAGTNTCKVLDASKPGGSPPEISIDFGLMTLFAESFLNSVHCVITGYFNTAKIIDRTLSTGYELVQTTDNSTYTRKTSIKSDQLKFVVTNFTKIFVILRSNASSQLEWASTSIRTYPIYVNHGSYFILQTQLDKKSFLFQDTSSTPIEQTVTTYEA